MTINAEDLARFSHEVRRFVSKLDFRAGVTTKSTLWLECATISDLHIVLVNIKQAVAHHMLDMTKSFEQWVDEGSVLIEYGGVSIMLVCRQKMMLPSGKAAGARDVNVRIFRKPDEGKP